MTETSKDDVLSDEALALVTGGLEFKPEPADPRRPAIDKFVHTLREIFRRLFQW